MPEELYKKVFKFIPRFTVDVIIKKGSSILLTKRDIPPFRGYWHLPGGTIRYGERIKEAVKRVAKEETGLKVKIKKLIGIYDSPKGIQVGM
jgi:8-oxo-dGTP diphosphatase